MDIYSGRQKFISNLTLSDIASILNVRFYYWFGIPLLYPVAARDTFGDAGSENVLQTIQDFLLSKHVPICPNKVGGDGSIINVQQRSIQKFSRNSYNGRNRTTVFVSSSLIIFAKKGAITQDIILN